jgi:hypothetical protein
VLSSFFHCLEVLECSRSMHPPGPIPRRQLLWQWLWNARPASSKLRCHSRWRLSMTGRACRQLALRCKNPTLAPDGFQTFHQSMTLRPDCLRVGPGTTGGLLAIFTSWARMRGHPRDQTCTVPWACRREHTGGRPPITSLGISHVAASCTINCPVLFAAIQWWSGVRDNWAG